MESALGMESDVIVIGGGAAGLSAALMLGRACRRVVVVDSGSPRNRFASHLHGVLGHDGLDPAELLARGRAEVGRYGVEVLAGEVDSVRETADFVEVTLAAGETPSAGRTLRARALVVATGVTDQLPDVTGLAEHWGTGVLHCPYCHGWEVRGRRIGVLLTSPMTLHLAQLVRQWSPEVVVFTATLEPLDDAVRQRLQARGILLVSQPVAEVLGSSALTGVRTEDGQVVELDAIFTGGTLVPHDAFLAGLDLERTDTPLGSFLAVDETGKTSSDRIWAAGNVTLPTGNLTMSMNAGTIAGAMVNAALVAEDFDLAASGHAWPEVAPADFWENRYADSDQVWSGRVNAVLADVAATLAPGTALDLGCGEGADAAWLARHGWQAVGVDISPTAAARATSAARAGGLSEEQVRFVAAGLSVLGRSASELSASTSTLSAFDPAAFEFGDRRYDLVTASFLHSPVELSRTEILRQAAALVAPGGHLLITSHAAPPPWADASAHHHTFLGPSEELATLALDPARWKVVVAETRSRNTTAPDGTPAALDDTVLLLRRLP